MNKNIQNKSRFISQHLFGSCIDFGSEDINWDESLHALLEKETGMKIVRADKYGNPDIKIDFDKPFAKEVLKKYKPFDTILVSEVIEHLKRPYDFLIELKKILKPTGRIIITTPNAVSLAEIASMLSGFKHKKVYSGHIYNWNKQNMEDLFSNAELNIEKFQYISYYWRKNFIFKAIAYAIPFLKPNLFFIIKKT